MQKQNSIALLSSTQHRIPSSMQHHQQSKLQSSHLRHSRSNSGSNNNHFPSSSSSSSLLGYLPEYDNNNGRMYSKDDTTGYRKSMTTATTADRMSLPTLSPVPAVEEANHHRGGITAGAASLFETVTAWSSWLVSSLVACSSHDAALAVSFFFLWLAVGVIWTQVTSLIA